MDSPLATAALEGLQLALVLSAPVLVVSALVGIVVGLVQAATSLQDAALANVPKIAAVFAVLLVTGGWMGDGLLQLTTQLWETIPAIAR